MSVNYNEKQKAGRFIDLCKVLDRISVFILELKIMLCSFILERNLIFEPCRLYGFFNIIDKCRLWDGKKDGRVQLPHYVINWILNHNNHEWRITLDKNGRPSKGSKVTLTWLICYVWGVYPNQNDQDWETYECSHRCLCARHGKSNLVCTWADHLCWESSSNNQSRGYSQCLTFCHCGCDETLCRLYNVHYPYCL